MNNIQLPLLISNEREDMRTWVARNHGGALTLYRTKTLQPDKTFYIILLKRILLSYLTHLMIFILKFLCF